MHAYISGDSKFLSLLQGRFNRTQDGCLRDICDGRAYTALTSPGEFLTVPTNITLQMNTDGVQVFHSSSCTMWPVYFIINELPPVLRYRVCHAIVQSSYSLITVI